jgi:hypothetical protein
LSQIGAVLGIVAMVVAMLAATISRARRRGLWKVVAGLVGLRGECTVVHVLWRWVLKFLNSILSNYGNVCYRLFMEEVELPIL